MTGGGTPAETAMDEDSTKELAEAALFAGEAWFDPIERALRERIRGFIEELLEQELTEALGRRRHGRGPSPGTGMAAGSGD